MRTKTLTFTLMMILLSIMLLSPNLAVFAQAGGAVQVGFFEELRLPPGARIEVPLEVRGADNLYGVDIEIRFDPEVITIEDANPNVDGVQPALGTFLDAGLVLFNEVDNEEGIVRFVMSQVNPSEGKSGDGVLLVLYVSALQEGESELQVTGLELANRLGEGLESEPVDSVIFVESEAEESVATPIPVQDQAGLITIPTIAPTPTPTEVQPTAMPTEEVVVDEEPEQIGEDQEGVLTEEVETQEVDQEETEQEGRFSIMKYWWAVLLMIVVAIGMAVYLIKFRK
jgi:hypothetical protein